MLGSLAEIAIAAPLGFLAGLICGIAAGNRWIIIIPRERYRVVRRNGRDTHLDE